MLSHACMGKRIHWCFFVGAIVLAATFSGCQENPTASSTAEPNEESESKLTADEVLRKMAATYQSAASYADSGDVYFSAQHGDRKQVDPPLPFSCTYARPDKARLHLFDAGIVVDGEFVWATVRDVPGQILKQSAAKTFSIERLPSDPILGEAMNRGITQLRPWPIILLTNADALTTLLAGAEPPELIESESVQELPCFRVRINRPTSQQILWIDQENFLLRRMDFAGAELHRQLNADQSLKDLRAWIEFTGAQIDTDFPEDTFEFEAPSEARLVTKLVAPVMSPPPALGQKIGDFTLHTQQDAIHRANLVDKITVLCFWTSSEQACRGVLPGLEILKEKYQGEEQVQFFAISEDPSIVTPDKLLQTLRGWGSSLPILRDADSAAKEAFFVSEIPTVLVVGGDARIHDFQPGGLFTPAEADRAIQGLLSGDDVATYLVKQYDELRDRFQAELAKVTTAQESTQIEVPLTTIAPRTEPKYLRLEKLWTSDEIKAPGNVLVIPAETGNSRVIVFDGWRTLVEIDAEGKMLGRHELEMPLNSVASYLRTATDKDDKRWFVASSVNQQKLFVLDENLKVTLNFPEERHSGIADVQFADLAGDGKLALVVGYWGAVGVQCVTLDGQRNWSNRSIENVLQVVISNPDDEGHRRALCYSTSGTLVPINDEGDADEAIKIPGRTLSSLVSQDVDGDGKVEICALAIDPRNLGSFTALGLNEQGGELWSYPLPPGNHGYVVDRIVPARLGVNDGGWLLPGADGSIHLLTVGGDLVDSFNYGAAITGIGLAQFEGVPALLVSTPDTFSAWKLLPAEITEAD